ncbi:MAG: hypothetical protein Q9177_002958, partial [Variospora cf. flavescens]
FGDGDEVLHRFLGGVDTGRLLGRERGGGGAIGRLRGGNGAGAGEVKAEGVLSVDGPRKGVNGVGCIVVFWQSGIDEVS